VRIDPRNACVEAVGRLPDGTHPAQLAFAGEREMFLAGGKHLRRIVLP